MKIQKRVGGQLVHSAELPANFRDGEVKLLEFHEHVLVVPKTGDPLCIDKRTCLIVDLDQQRQIEARLIAAKHLGSVTSH